MPVKPITVENPARRHRTLICSIGCLLILALTVSLATRVFHITLTHGVTVQSNSPQAKRQHMDKDAARWVPPVSYYAGYGVVSFYPRMAPAGPPLPSLQFDESLYNRPPPSC